MPLCPKDPVGQVLLSLRFLPAAQRLEVGVLKIRTLQTDSDSGNITMIRIICIALPKASKMIDIVCVFL